MRILHLNRLITLVGRDRVEQQAFKKSEGHGFEWTYILPNKQNFDLD